MLSKEVAKRMLNNLLEIILDISDKVYQKRAWIRGEPPGTDFDETCCQFADFGDPILENYKDYGITENQYNILKKFRDKFRTFSDDNHWPQKFIDTPEWAIIMNLAKDVLNTFNYKKPP